MCSGACFYSYFIYFSSSFIKLAILFAAWTTKFSSHSWAFFSSCCAAYCIIWYSQLVTYQHYIMTLLYMLCSLTLIGFSDLLKGFGGTTGGVRSTASSFKLAQRTKRKIMLIIVPLIFIISVNSDIISAWLFLLFPSWLLGKE